MGYDFRHGAMEPGVEADEVRHVWKKAHRFAHDVNRYGSVQRSEFRVAFHFVDQSRSDDLIFLHRGAAGDHAMADCRRDGEIARVERIGYELKCYCGVGNGGRLIDELAAGCVLDPETALIEIADAVDCALVEFAALGVAGFIDGELDGGGTAV